ncbi:hypothetical protein D082_09630 [Synechocystis sp. PCC 6714]|nr:hypothetical protein D082_09630 [Synechocystis sp. PCC 6714]
MDWLNGGKKFFKTGKRNPMKIFHRFHQRAMGNPWQIKS